jgi:5-methylcytosine-specific restriction endonuclease McrA
MMCGQWPASCPSLKNKNSQGVLKAYKEYVRKPAKQVYEDLPKEVKDRMNWNKGNRYAEFSYNGKGNHKAALIQERGHTCEKCNLSTWLGQPIALELEHIDADRKNNVKENLKLFCLNCHAQTPTWKRGKLGAKVGWKTKKYSDEEMIETIKSSTCINQVLKKLDLRYGSASTIVNVMSKYKISFKED